MEKDRYNGLEMEIIVFGGEDIIVTSGPDDPLDCEFHVPIN